MVGRELPFITRLDTYEDDDPERAQVVKEAVDNLIRCEGWQLVLFITRQIQDEALLAISQGADAAFMGGQIAAIEKIRAGLREAGQPGQVDTYDEGLTHE